MSWRHRRRADSVYTPTLVRGGWVVEATPRPIYPWGAEIASVLHAADLAPRLVWTCVQERKAFYHTWFKPQTVQPVAIHYTDHVTADPNLLQISNFNYIWGFWLYGFWSRKHLLETNFLSQISIICSVSVNLSPSFVRFLLLHPFWHSQTAGAFHFNFSSTAISCSRRGQWRDVQFCSLYDYW